jgi:hypothetical protein
MRRRGNVDMDKLTPAWIVAVSVLLAGILICGCNGGGSPTPTEHPLMEALDQIAAEVEEIRELGPATGVEYRFVTRDELSEFLMEEADEEYPPEEALVDQEIYVLLDRLGEGRDLRTIILDVMEEQVIGFYDDDTKQLNVVSESNDLSALDRVTFAHEYTHALQDYHFGLDTLPLEDGNNSDATMAALCLIEGDAVMSQTYYMLGSLTADELMAVLQEAEQSESGQFDSAPRFMQVDLLFPYGREYDEDELEGGLSFVAALYNENEWEAVNQAYADPPRSTEQILHPEKYLGERDDPVEVTLPDLAGVLGGKWVHYDADVLGELYVRTYLETYVALGMAKEAAEGWDGDRFVYLKNDAEDKLLVWRSTWDTAEDAGEFFEAYSAFVYDKYDGQWESLSEMGTSRQWTMADSNVYLGQDGADILVVIAPDGAVTDKVLAEFPEFRASQPCP